VSDEDRQRLPRQRPDGTQVGREDGDDAAARPAGAAAQARRRRRITRMRRRLLLAEAVADLSHQALTAQEPDELLRQSLQVAVDVVGAEYGTAVRRLSNGQLRVAKELGPQPLLPGTILPLAAERSYVLTVVESASPFVSADLRHDPRVTPPEPLLRRGVVSGLAVPVRGSQAVVGVLAVHSRHQRWFDRHDVAVLKALASVVATAWEQAVHREQLGHQALHDPLTGLANRILFMDRLEHVLTRRADGDDRGDTNDAAVMLVDLDDFKRINDSFGHAAGDELLKAAAHRLRSAVRPQDTIARLGGDEFGVVCEDVADEADAVGVATRMRTVCAEPVDLSGSVQSVSASFGITLSRRTGAPPRDAEALLAEADAALYRAKALGRGEVQVFDENLRSTARQRRQLETELSAGLERGEFRLHYQPVRRSGDLRPVGVEALLRWEHPTRGLLMPGEFMPTAEQSGLLAPLGRWVVHTACSQVARWQQRGAKDPLWVAVNVSPRQLGDAGLPAAVATAQSDAGLAEGSLVLELTESALMPGDAAHREALVALRETGARLFLDDFGTGYSSLTHLTELPVQAVKIDRSFVTGMPANRRHAAVVSALIALSAQLDLRVIAEGVETSEQLQALRDMRCQAVQGFLLDLPKDDPDVL
jgi:diguanylate cyclase (GGDEF)-like protein